MRRTTCQLQFGFTGTKRQEPRKRSRQSKRWISSCSRPSIVRVASSADGSNRFFFVEVMAWHFGRTPERDEDTNGRASGQRCTRFCSVGRGSQSIYPLVASQGGQEIPRLACACPVDRYTSHVIFLMQFAEFISCISHCMAQVSVRASFHLHVIHDERLIVRSLSVSSYLSFSCFSPLFASSLPHSACTLTCTPSSMSTASRETTAAPSPNEEYCPLAIYLPPTGYEPNVLDDFHHLETSEMIFEEESSDIDTEPSYLCDAELDDETTGMAPSSPLFIQEREEPADRIQSYHSYEESLLSAQSSFAHTSTERPIYEPSSCPTSTKMLQHEQSVPPPVGGPFGPARIKILLARINLAKMFCDFFFLFWFFFVFLLFFLLFFLSLFFLLVSSLFFSFFLCLFFSKSNSRGQQNHIKEGRECSTGRPEATTQLKKMESRPHQHTQKTLSKVCFSKTCAKWEDHSKAAKITPQQRPFSE